MSLYSFILLLPFVLVQRQIINMCLVGEEVLYLISETITKTRLFKYIVKILQTK